MNVSSMFKKKAMSVVLLKKAGFLSEEEAQEKLNAAINAYELNKYAALLNTFTNDIATQMKGFDDEKVKTEEANKRIVDFVSRFKEFSHDLIQAELDFDELRVTAKTWIQ